MWQLSRELAHAGLSARTLRYAEHMLDIETERDLTADELSAVYRVVDLHEPRPGARGA